MTRFNFTQRQRIRRESFDLTVSEIDQKIYLNFTMNLADYKFEPDAVVHIHVNAAGLRAKWIQACGLVAELSPGMRYELPHTFKERTLTAEIFVQAPLSARLVGSSANFQILGEGQEAHTVESLLPVQVDLEGEQMWEMSFPDGLAPILHIHESLDDAESFFSSPVVRALVLPKAFREIVTHLLENWTGEHDEPYIIDWEHALKNLGIWSFEESLVDYDPLEREDIIERIVEDFCRQNDFVGDYHEYVGEAL